MFLLITNSKNNFGGGLEVKMAKILKENFSKGGPLNHENRDFEVLSQFGPNNLKGRFKNLLPR